MLFFPPCKINIGLRILRRRQDGFHDLELSFFPLHDFCDILEITPAEENSFVCTGIDIPGNPDDNLVIRARNLLQQASKGRCRPCRIHLHKRIPSGAGLGGGSSDAAYTLAGLNQLFELGFPHAELAAMAESLGSDCPFFLKSVPCIGEGKGEKLKELHTGIGKTFEAVVVIPDFPISTAQAYRGCIPDESRPSLHTLFTEDYRNWKNTLTNDFEKTLFPIHPVLEDIKNELYAHGAFYASLSGSGSAVFGLFEREGADKEPYGFSPRYLIRRSRIEVV